MDTSAEVAWQLNRSGIDAVRNLLLTHLDPDHVEGIRVVEQITLDFCTWQAYPDLQIRLLLPEFLRARLGNIHTAYGPLIDYLEACRFVRIQSFDEPILVDGLQISAIPVDRGDQQLAIYFFEQEGTWPVSAQIAESADVVQFMARGVLLPKQEVQVMDTIIEHCRKPIYVVAVTPEGIKRADTISKQRGLLTIQFSIINSPLNLIDSMIAPFLACGAQGHSNLCFHHADGGIVRPLQHVRPGTAHHCLFRFLLSGLS